jgi:hypothetical protein
MPKRRIPPAVTEFLMVAAEGDRFEKGALAGGCFYLSAIDLLTVGSTPSLRLLLRYTR